jgi:hypothetical protein
VAAKDVEFDHAAGCRETKTTVGSLCWAVINPNHINN